MPHQYNIELAGQQIGTTKLEFADPPMGVVHGKIKFSISESPFQLVSSHCVQNGIKLNTYDLTCKLIDTQIIPGLKIFKPGGTELKARGSSIAGMDPNDFHIEVYGIPHQIMESEFRFQASDYYSKKG